MNAHTAVIVTGPCDRINKRLNMMIYYIGIKLLRESGMDIHGQEETT